MDFGDRASSIGALADENRRALYEYVVSEPDAVGREQAANEVGLPLHTAAFHLDRLVEEGLLEVEFRRLTGRSGPGAGRPSKLYRRVARTLSVSLPPRSYDLVGDILATAVDRATDGHPLAPSLAECAHERGVSVGASAVGADITTPLPAVGEVLAGHGYEPRVADDVVTLRNCPFDTLAEKHTELVCGINRDFVQGIVDGLGVTRVRACLEPEAGICCVKVRSRSDG